MALIERGIPSRYVSLARFLRILASVVVIIVLMGNSSGCASTPGEEDNALSKKGGGWNGELNIITFSPDR